MSRSGSARYRALEMANSLAKKGGTASDDLALFGAGFFCCIKVVERTPLLPSTGTVVPSEQTII